MPSASETTATAVTKGVLRSVRQANLRLRITALDEPRCCRVYPLMTRQPAARPLPAQLAGLTTLSAAPSPARSCWPETLESPLPPAPRTRAPPLPALSRPDCDCSRRTAESEPGVRRR